MATVGCAPGECSCRRTLPIPQVNNTIKRHLKRYAFESQVDQWESIAPETGGDPAQDEEVPTGVTETVVSEGRPEINISEWEKYKIPHRFPGFNPKRMDLDNLPRSRTDIDGRSSRLVWNGVECQKCGLQVRWEKRMNMESSLNVYAHASIPIDLLRSCPEEKNYPLLWRSRDPFLVLDVLGVDD